MGERVPGEPALVVEEVHMRFRVREDRGGGLPLPRRAGGVREVHALRGVSLTVPKGQRLGVVGRNGSGKSTLLSIMAGLRAPTSGRVLASGEPVLLGVGAALNGDLSGYRNVLLGCTALGLRRAEAIERAPEILAFADLTDVAGLPMRTYSSGMRARLRFAVATVVQPDVLLVDEALAAGDRAFRRRSRERLLAIADAAGAVVLVSHNAGEVQDLCNRAIWLDDGVVVVDDCPGRVLDAYEHDRRPDL